MMAVSYRPQSVNKYYHVSVRSSGCRNDAIRYFSDIVFVSRGVVSRVWLAVLRHSVRRWSMNGCRTDCRSVSIALDVLKACNNCAVVSLLSSIGPRHHQRAKGRQAANDHFCGYAFLWRLIRPPPSRRSTCRIVCSSDEYCCRNRYREYRV